MLGLDEPGTPVKVVEPYQMLGEIETDLIDALGIDVVPLMSPYSMFGFKLEDWKQWRTPDGTAVLVPGKFNTDPEPNGEWLNYGGDKMWPAPQGWDSDQQWPGPPDPVLDGGAYAAEVTTEAGRPVSVKLTSRKDKRSGIQFSRVLRIFNDSTHVSIDATMKNIDTKPRRWGIWTVTQFDTSNRHGDGYNQNYWAYCPLRPDSIFHKGYSVLYGMVNNISFKPDYQNQMMRVHYENRVGKIGIDSAAGWVATVDSTDGYVFVHRFTYEPGKAYPDDSSVEFWSNGLGEFVAWGKVVKMPEEPEDNPYLLESEILSPFAALNPGETYSFHYDRYAAKVPVDSSVKACSDVGVTCEPPSARLRDGKLTLTGQFGVFYKANFRLAYLDENGSELEQVLFGAPVTPLQPLILSKLLKSSDDVIVPPNARKIAIYLYHTKGRILGELARVPIQRD